eukprot:12219038-Prorocentrum_lima.AAC.1
MTSSLVGSEMCIRDRSSTAAYTSHGDARGSATGPKWRDACRHVGCVEAVSYTHLTLPTICSV